MEAKITEAKVLDNYRVALKFSDGTTGEKDFSDLAGKGVFASWINYENFKNVHISHNGRVLEWDGELDFCADSLYMAISGLSFAEYAVD